MIPNSGAASCSGWTDRTTINSRHSRGMRVRCLRDTKKRRKTPSRLWSTPGSAHSSWVEPVNRARHDPSQERNSYKHCADSHTHLFPPARQAVRILVVTPFLSIPGLLAELNPRHLLTRSIADTGAIPLSPDSTEKVFVMPSSSSHSMKLEISSETCGRTRGFTARKAGLAGIEQVVGISFPWRYHESEISVDRSRRRSVQYQGVRSEPGMRGTEDGWCAPLSTPTIRLQRRWNLCL